MIDVSTIRVSTITVSSLIDGFLDCPILPGSKVHCIPFRKVLLLLWAGLASCIQVSRSSSKRPAYSARDFWIWEMGDMT